MIKNFSKILIIHPGGIGDLVMFVPALKILRENLPKAKIDLFVAFSLSAGDIFQKRDLVNRIFKFSLAENNLFNKIKFIYKLRKEKYDLSIMPSVINPLRGGILSFLIGAKTRVGERIEGKIAPGYTHTCFLDKQKHAIGSNVDLLRVINLKIAFPLPFPFLEISSKERKFADNFLIRNNFENKILIGFHLGGYSKNQKFRCWPKENFIELGNKILNDLENTFILLFGGSEERKICLEVKSKLDKNTMAICRYSLKQVVALIDKCKIFVSSDTGLNHIASTTKTNLISIYGPTDHKRTASISRQGIYVLKEKCRYPYNLDTSKNYDINRIHTCLKKIASDRVLDKIKEILVV